MTTPIVIVRQTPQRDGEGFASVYDVVVADIMVYKEDRHGTEKWANRAAFSTATSLFRFRKIPGVAVDTSMFIRCAAGRYQILSVEDVGQRGMYTEVLADTVAPSER
jgi:hypothetical protein